MFWSTPAIGVLAGVGFLIAARAGGYPGLGWVLLGLMVVFSVAAVVASRWSETVRGLLSREDERFSNIDRDATALVGLVLIVAVIAGAAVELAHGRSGQPYVWLGALAGITYVVAATAARLRR
jgi:hypothetical protein